jgi:hypothetical protein
MIEIIGWVAVISWGLGLAWTLYVLWICRDCVDEYDPKPPAERPEPRRPTLTVLKGGKHDIAA